MELKGKIGLVLGSGGARGMAHIGVLQALNEFGIKPDIIVGSSIGSIIGAAYATGAMGGLREILSALDFITTVRVFMDISVNRGGIIKGKRAMEFINRFMPDTNIEDLPLRYAAITTDLESGDAVVLDKGSLHDAIRASISIPGVFTPVARDGKTYIDGGISSPVPITTAKAMGAETVIAVNIDNKKICPIHTVDNPHAELARKLFASTSEDRLAWLSEILRDKMPVIADKIKAIEISPDIFDVLSKSSRLFEDRIALAEIQTTPPDILIEPPVGDIQTLDFMRHHDAVKAGYDETVKVLAALSTTKSLPDKKTEG